MKICKFTAAASMMFLVCTTQARTVPSKCQPLDNSRWKEAYVSVLNNSSQFLYQVRAAGNYLTADLICSLGNCLGFIGGEGAKGTLQFTTQGPFEPVSVTIQAQDPAIPDMMFTCQ